MQPWEGSGWAPENLRKRGLSPATVVDVGAGHGTPELYEAFPEAYQVLIEPLVDHEPDLAQVLTRYRGEYLPTAVGEQEGVATLRVDPEAPGVSSMLPRISRRGLPVEDRTIPMTTLDSLAEERGWKPPFGVKIDAEGYEYPIIQGALQLLKQTQFVIAEVSVAKRFEGGHSFADFIHLMDSRGFRLCDILEGARSSALELNYVDAMFRRYRAPS